MHRLQLVSAFCVATLMLLGTMPQPTRADPAQPSPAGRYRCEGRDFNGVRYFGEVTITRHGDTYLFAWDVTFEGSGRSRYDGVGLLTENLMSASWEGAGKAGVMVYRVGKNGELTGRWTIRGNQGTSTEKLTPVNR